MHNIDTQNITANKKLNINIINEAIKDMKKEIISMKNMKNVEIEYVIR